MSGQSKHSPGGVVALNGELHGQRLKAQVLARNSNPCESVGMETCLTIGSQYVSELWVELRRAIGPQLVPSRSNPDQTDASA